MRLTKNSGCPTPVYPMPTHHFLVLFACQFVWGLVPGFRFLLIAFPQLRPVLHRVSARQPCQWGVHYSPVPRQSATRIRFPARYIVLRCPCRPVCPGKQVCQCADAHRPLQGGDAPARPPNQRRFAVLLRCAAATRLHTRCGRIVRAYALYLTSARLWSFRVGRSSFGLRLWRTDSCGSVTYRTRRWYPRGPCAILPVFAALFYRALVPQRQGATCGRVVGKYKTCRARLLSCMLPLGSVLVVSNPSRQ